MSSILIHNDGDILHRLTSEPFRHLVVFVPAAAFNSNNVPFSYSSLSIPHKHTFFLETSSSRLRVLLLVRIKTDVLANAACPAHERARLKHLNIFMIQLNDRSFCNGSLPKFSQTYLNESMCLWLGHTTIAFKERAFISKKGNQQISSQLGYAWQ